MNDDLFPVNAGHTHGPDNTDSLTILAAHEHVTHNTKGPVEPPSPKPQPPRKALPSSIDSVNIDK